MLHIPAAPCTILSTHWYLMAAGPSARGTMVGLRSDPILLPHKVLGIRDGNVGLKGVSCPPPVLHLPLHQLQVWREVCVGLGGSATHLGAVGLPTVSSEPAGWGCCSCWKEL